MVKFSESRDALKAKEVEVKADKDARIEMAKLENQTRVEIAKLENDAKIQEAKWKAHTTASQSVQRTLNLDYLGRGRLHSLDNVNLVDLQVLC